MKTTMKTFTIAAIITITAAAANALTIDIDTYFAYATTSDGTTVVLSQSPCESQEFSKDGWKKSHYFWRNQNGNGLSACWKPTSAAAMDICWVNPNPSQGSGLYHCMPVGKGVFKNTSSLPSQAKF